MSRATFLAATVRVVAGPARSMPAPMAIIAADEAARAGITADEIMTGTTHHIAHARQDAMRRIREGLGYSLPRIGRFFGRDHSTVVYGLRASAARAGEFSE